MISKTIITLHIKAKQPYDTQHTNTYQHTRVHKTTQAHNNNNNNTLHTSDDTIYQCETQRHKISNKQHIYMTQPKQRIHNSKHTSYKHTHNQQTVDNILIYIATATTKQLRKHIKAQHKDKTKTKHLYTSK